MSNDLFLIYINRVGQDVNGFYTYEFLFNTTTDISQEDWDFNINCSKTDVFPNESNYVASYIVYTKINLSLIQDSCCFGMKQCQDGVIALGYENIDDYEEYPEHRLVFHYGDDFKSVEENLLLSQLELQKKDLD